MGKSGSPSLVLLLAAAMAAAVVLVASSSSQVAAFPVAGLPEAEPPFPNPWLAFQNLSGCHMGDERDGLARLKDYLSHFGYLPEAPSSTPFSDAFDADLEAAIATYQRNFGLNATGFLDPSTVSQMVAPRCGVADVINGTSTMDRRNASSSSSGHGRHLYTYFPGGPMWPPFRRELRYAITATAATSIDRATLSAVFARAFARWSDATTLRFAETASEADADITIGFYAGSHGDGEAFDGPLGTLAHAFSPTDGRFHLDAAEAWVADGQGGASSSSPGAVDLESVAVHEIGHLLGLGHSSVQGAIMYPTIRTGTRKVDLEADDVQGIQSMYGTNPDFKGVAPTSPSTSSREMDSSAGGASSRPGSRFVAVVVAVGLLLLLSL
ncbi:hypothetical protein ACQJBY_055609 [Aegilops geniculata]